MRRVWAGVHGRDVAVGIFEPESGWASGILVIVPSIGFEADVTYRYVMALAQRGAAEGLLVAVPDLSGYGDSSDGAHLERIAEAWVEDVGEVLTAVRAVAPGVPVTVVGFRLGAAVASALPHDTMDALVFWQPISGRQFVRRQRLLYRVSRGEPALGVDDSTELLGSVLTPGQIRDVQQLVLRRDADILQPVRRPITAHADDSYRAVVEPEDLKTLTGVCKRGAQVEVDTSSWRKGEGRPAAGVVERFRSIGPHHLAAVTAGPDRGPVSETCVIFTAQGAERATGPGNLWVLLARELAGAGVCSVRADRRGIGWHTDGTSPRQPNPFTHEAVDDVAEVVRACRAAGHRRIVVVSSCAGAWLAMAAARRSPVDGIVAFSVPAWGASPDRFGDAFLEYWNGPAPVGAGAKNARSKRRAHVVHRLAQWPSGLRLAMWVRQTARAAQWRSLGLPVLTRLPRSTAVHLVIGGRDEDFLRVSAGMPVLRLLRNRGRDISLIHTEGMDHALRTEHSRRAVRQIVGGVLATDLPQRHGDLAPAEGGAGTAPPSAVTAGRNPALRS